MEKNDELINWLGYVDSLMVKDSESAIDVSRIISLNNTKYYMDQMDTNRYIIHFPSDIRFDIEYRATKELISNVNVYDETVEDMFLNWSLIYTELINEKTKYEALNKYKKYLLQVALFNIDYLVSQIEDKKEREKVVNMIPGYMLELMEDYVYARRRKKEKQER